MNTLLATGDAPLHPGFVDWRDWCARNPAFDIGRLMARSNPQLSAAECVAYAAPFADAGHRAGTRAFPRMVPEAIDDDGAALSRAARDFWRGEWSGRSLMAIGLQDPVLGDAVMQALRRDIRGCPEPLRLAHAGHFVPESGRALAEHAVIHFS